MSEFKHNFSQAKMNKDLDERVVPNGQYRDALNIEVATSEGSSVGAAQTLRGNSKLNKMHNSTGDAYYGIPETASVVATIASADRDKVYSLISAGDKNNASSDLGLRKDYILEYDVFTKTNKYVFVDIYKVTSTHNSSAGGNSTAIVETDKLYVNDISSVASTTQNRTGIRVGMRVIIDDELGNSFGIADNIQVTSVAYQSLTLGWVVQLNQKVKYQNNSPTLNVEFQGERVLNFDKNNLITGINILDDFLFWTDNNFEPKKINIPRSIAGTGGTERLTGVGLGFVVGTLDTFKGDTDYFHTRLVKEKAMQSPGQSSYEIVTFPDQKRNVWFDESHATVIKKAPTQPLQLQMSRSAAQRQVLTGTSGFQVPVDTLTNTQTENSINFSGSSIGDTLANVEFQDMVDFRVGDILVLVEASSGLPQASFGEHRVRVEVTASNVTSSSQLSSVGFGLKIVSIGTNISNITQKWFCRLYDKEPLFEFKFPRFSYRYKYTDGEYSPFAPFSEVAFLPSEFDYHPKKGYNLGMVNSMRSLKLIYYHYDEYVMPDDVIEIDLLYKETNNPTVYTVKTVRRSDEDPVWPDLASGGQGYSRGEYEVTTDMIHAVVDSSQLLRPYDNVPRKALAQEISANRVIYGNYVQNRTILKDPVINISLEKSDIAPGSSAAPSVKTQRTYQVGVVYSDKYGRETPVLTSKQATITVPKDAVVKRNRLNVSLGEGTEVPQWAKYYSFYIKETSIEYYTMAMDRWYDAADGNIWLTFPSSDRNKIDEETFLELKTGHGANNIITDPAKYKILAIESEAPESLKLVRQDLGSLYDTGASKIGNNTNGYPLQDTTFITVKIDAFESAYGSSLHETTPDFLFLTLYGPYSQSNEYKVTMLTKGPTDYKLQIDTKFGQDAAFVSSDDTYANRIGGLYIKLFSGKLESKPEFEGRFFVKVFRDEFLLSNLTQTSGVEYVVDKTWGLRYINNNGYINQDKHAPTRVDPQYYCYTQNGNQVGDIVNGNTASNQVNSDKNTHPTEYNYPSYTGGDFDFNGQALYTWNPVDGPIDLSKPVKELNDGGDSHDFWSSIMKAQDFFIDAATAFSLTGEKSDHPGNHYNAGSNYTHFNDNTTGTSLSGAANTSAAQAGSNKEGSPQVAGSTNGHPGSLKDGNGLPSRGIWGSQGAFSYMDISWTGTGEGYNGSNWSEGVNAGGFPHQLMNTGNGSGGDTRLEAADFIKDFVTPGTVFRFQRDPDETEYVVYDYSNEEQGYNNTIYWENFANRNTGAFGIRNSSFFSTALNNKPQYAGYNMRQRWTVKVRPEIGSGISGYNPVRGTDPNLIKDEDDINFRRALKHDGVNQDVIEILKPFVDPSGQSSTFTENPAIWETVPKESVDIDIYYQASGLIPLVLEFDTLEEYIPIGTTFLDDKKVTHTVTGILENDFGSGELGLAGLASMNPGPVFKATKALGTGATTWIPSYSSNKKVTFTKRDNYSFTAEIDSIINWNTPETDYLWFTLHGGRTTTNPNHKLFKQSHILSWHNCWNFGNGVESDRIRDDFNAPQLDNGVKASTVLAEQVREERREHGLIWSGIYNSTSGVNNTNQFLAAEAITKDLNPVYGSIQKILNRGTRLVMFCENNILRADTNKDLLFNADGNSQVVGSNKVVGSAVAYQGNYGVSKNPESVAATPYNVYFSDVARGAVCSLSPEGVTAISDKGMTDFFADAFTSRTYRSLGSYDTRKGEYNITILDKQHPTFQVKPDKETTVSYSTASKGWSSFKSFIPQQGVSLNNQYYTSFNGHLWQHHVDIDQSGVAVDRNNFYGLPYSSSVTLLFNDDPGSVKSFGTINYEGSAARVTEFDDTVFSMLNGDYSLNNGNGITPVTVSDGEYYNLSPATGWYVESVLTNLQSCGEIEFKNKEGKYFGFPSGDRTSLKNLDEKEFSVQGIGVASMTHSGDAGSHPEPVKITVSNNTSTTYTGNTGTGVKWDQTAD